MVCFIPLPSFLPLTESTDSEHLGNPMVMQLQHSRATSHRGKLHPFSSTVLPSTDRIDRLGNSLHPLQPESSPSASSTHLRTRPHLRTLPHLRILPHLHILTTSRDVHQMDQFMWMSSCPTHFYVRSSLKSFFTTRDGNPFLVDRCNVAKLERRVCLGISISSFLVS